MITIIIKIGLAWLGLSVLVALLFGWIVSRGKEETMSELKLRPEVRRFSEVMERRLRENDYKGGWKDCDYSYLTRRLQEEIDELHIAVQCKSLDLIPKEAADVANFAMMIADKFGGLMLESLPGKEE